jgi:hypothetical protein
LGHSQSGCRDWYAAPLLIQDSFQFVQSVTLVLAIHTVSCASHDSVPALSKK